VGQDHRSRPRPSPDHLSIKQAAEGGTVAAEYQDAFGEHAYDEAGNYIGTAGEDEPAASEDGSEVVVGTEPTEA